LEALRCLFLFYKNNLKIFKNSGIIYIESEEKGRMKMIEIYWQDLTPAKQAEILEKLGENCNWDVLPITIIETEEE
jgi:hypothetical protein